MIDAPLVVVNSNYLVQQEATTRIAVA